MKNSLQRQLIMLSKRLLYGFLIQLFLCTVVLANTGNAQRKTIDEVEVSLNLKEKTLLQFFKLVEAKTDFKFTYNNDLVDLKQKVTVVEDDRTLYKILQSVSYQTRLNFVQVNENIHVKSEGLKNTQQAVEIAEVQDVTISGTVTDTNGEPIPGVTVSVPGTTVGTATDLDGNYTLSVPEGSTLVFSFIGFETQSISIGDQSLIDVTLREDMTSLDEVVVVGYGTQKKVNLTGAVSTVNAEQIEGVPATNVGVLLQGRMPGVAIQQGTGQPGRDHPRILIRGLGTMNNSSPMILIDGLESTMDDINPLDVESVNVLKDAASASIYGTRAANGVILITTKRGKSGTPKVSYNTFFGKQVPVALPEVVSSADHARLENEGNLNAGFPLAYSEEEIKKFQDGSDPFNYPNTNWMDLLLKGSGASQSHSLNVSGGTEASSYMLSLGYFDQQGLMKQANYDRYNLRFNLDSKVTNWLKIGLNSSFSRRDVEEPTMPLFSSGINQFFRQAIMIPSTYPNKDKDGLYVSSGDGNIIAAMEKGGKYLGKSSRAIGSVFSEIGIIKGLTLKGVMGVDYTLNDDKTHFKTVTYSGGLFQGPNQVRDYLERSTVITLQSYLTYVREMGKHGLKVLLGISREAADYNIDQLYRNTFPSDEINQIDAGAAQSMTNSGNSREVNIGSYFGRINYDFDTKYLFEATMRRDGSSKFGSAYRWGTFPSFSVGWRISAEEFMENVNLVKDLKLRASWGKLGNHNISDYLYLSKIRLGLNYPFGQTMYDGGAQTQAEIADISWETSTSWNIGIDATFFGNNLLMASIDYYNRYTDDILAPIPVSVAFGLPAPVVNAGAMSNKGIELQLSHRNSIGAVEYNVSANMAMNENKVENYPEPALGQTIRSVGESWDAWYGYEWIGIYQTDEEAKASAHVVGAPVEAGDLIFKDQNGDGIVDASDRIVLGNQIPRLTYGFNFGLAYKNFDLTAFFQGASKAFNQLGGTMWPLEKGNGGASLKMHFDRTIVEDGKVIKQGHYPRTLTGGNQSHNNQMSSFRLFETDYLRLKNLQIGYNVPTTVIGPLQTIRVYFSGTNLLTFTKYPKGFDPEIIGTNNYVYPQVSFYTLGLNVNF
jgi:TonB-linked SusC/RagA family outer membrane protein